MEAPSEVGMWLVLNLNRRNLANHDGADSSHLPTRLPVKRTRYIVNYLRMHCLTLLPV